MPDSIGASVNDVKVSSTQNSLRKFQTHIRYISSVYEDCHNEPIDFDAHGIGRCMFCASMEDVN
jgi:hypothetical protein